MDSDGRKVKIAMFSEAPPVNASARIRCAELVAPLRQKGFDVKYYPPSSASTWRFFLLRRRKLFPGYLGALEAFYFLFLVLPRRILQILLIRDCDIVFISRGLFPYFSPFLERLIKRMGKKIIFDFDDALYVQSGYVESRPSALRRLLMNPGVRFGQAIKCADTLTVSNEHLLEYAMSINSNSFILRPHIVPDRYKVKEFRGDATGAPVIGWMGNPSNFPLIETIRRPLEKLADKFPGMAFHVISSAPFSFGGPKVKVVNIEWNIETFAEEMSRFDIGVMPQLDSEYTRGKSGVKALEYMAGGLPVVASNYGGGLIENGANGFVVGSDDEWVEKIELLIKDNGLRAEMGAAGRRKALAEEFSLDGKIEKLAEIIRKLL